MKQLKKLVVATIVGALFLIPNAAFAGNPHFVGDPTIERVGDSLHVSGKVAGLGNEEQINVTVTALAECVNRGGNKPKADNKQAVSVEGDFPVQNGKALFSLVLDGGEQISPSCSPPMSIVYSNVVVTANGLVYEAPGTF